MENDILCLLHVRGEQLKKDNSPGNLRKLIEDEATIVFRKNMRLRPLKEEHYEKLWEMYVIGGATSKFGRLHNGDTMLDENFAVIQQAGKELKSEWIEKLKSQHKIKDESYWRMKKIEDEEKRNSRNEKGNIR